VTKIVNALSIRVSPRDIKSKDTRNLLNVIMQQWLPLSTATFQAIVDIIPPPDVAQSQRIPFMLHPEKARESSTPLSPNNPIEEGLYRCKQDDEAVVVAYVSKMFAINRGELPEHRPKEITAEEMRQRGREERERRAAMALGASNGVEMDGIEGLTKQMDELETAPAVQAPETSGETDGAAESSEALLAFSRVFSGKIRRGTPLVATLPKYLPELGASHPKNQRYIARVQAKELYMMMGRDLVAVDEVPAGHVCAIGGFEGLVHRNATLWAPNARGVEAEIEGSLVNLAGISLQSAPIVRVALEPDNPGDMPKLVRGLQILNQADPCAEYLVQETGEHVILTAGELHLEVSAG
jgi:ribosome assembly protein 1